jgi:hypothetical protein
MMATLADIRLTLADLILAAVYPNGTGQPSIISGMTGSCGVFQNDFKPGDIDTRVSAGDVLVSVVDLPNATSTTRFTPLEIDLPAATPLLIWSVTPTTATLSGTLSAGQIIVLIVNRVAFRYTAAANDTIWSALNQLAVAIAAELEIQTFVSGGTVSIPNAFDLQARLGVTRQVITEVGRQMSRFEVRVLAATEAVRSAAARVIKPALDFVTRLPLPDGTVAWVKSGIETSDWRPAKLGIASGCMIFPVEWPTVIPGTAAELIGLSIAVQGGAGDLAAFTATEPPVITING